MFDHVGIKVRDLQASIRFYEPVLGALGYQLDSQGDGYAGLGKPGAAAFWLYQTDQAVGPGTHVAFSAKDRQGVQQFHALGLKSGGRDNGGPGPRPDYSDAYYAAFLLDPDGHNVEAVCFV